jgi:hypothetical protein
MKRTGISVMVYQLLLTVAFLFTQILVIAQDSTGSVSKTTVSTESTSSSTTWYTQPWVWVVGGAVFLIILVALLRGNSSSDREVSRTTVIKDDRL